MPKIIGQSIGEHRERTRDKLFDAVGALLSELSYEQITLSMVAKRAGIGRTAIYNHFPDKDGLLFDFINQNTTTFAQELKFAIESLDNPLDQLCTYIRYQLLLKERWNLVWRADIRALVSDQNRDRFHEHALLVEQHLCQILEDAMEQGLIPRQGVISLSRLIHSNIACLPIPKDTPEREAIFNTIETFILRGVGADPDYSRPPLNQTSKEWTNNWSPGQFAHAEKDSSVLSASRCPVHHP